MKAKSPSPTVTTVFHTHCLIWLLISGIVPLLVTWDVGAEWPIGIILFSCPVALWLARPCLNRTAIERRGRERLIAASSLGLFLLWCSALAAAFALLIYPLWRGPILDPNARPDRRTKQQGARADNTASWTNMVDASGTSLFGWNGDGALEAEDGPWNQDRVSYGYNSARLRQRSCSRSAALPGPTATFTIQPCA